MMRRAVLTAALTAFALLATAQQWAPFTSKEAGLTVSFPKKPTTQTRSDVDGGMTFKTFTFHVGTTNSNYMASSTILPKGTTKAIRNNFRQGILSGFTTTSGARVSSQEAATYGGVKGRVYHFQNAQDVRGSLWIGETANRMFTLTIAKRVQAPTEERKKFFGSFKLAK